LGKIKKKGNLGTGLSSLFWSTYHRPPLSPSPWCGTDVWALHVRRTLHARAGVLVLGAWAPLASRTAGREPHNSCSPSLGSDCAARAVTLGWDPSVRTICFPSPWSPGRSGAAELIPFFSACGSKSVATNRISCLPCQSLTGRFP
jgi:hypothetical protein